MCSANYTDISASASSTKYHKPQYTTLFRSIRKANSDFIDYLKKWPPSSQEIKNHHGKPPPIKVNWKERLKRLKNCTFLGPKYRPLTYQITINSVIDGVRLHTTNTLRGICPHCGTVASTQHMQNNLFSQTRCVALVLILCVWIKRKSSLDAFRIGLLESSSDSALLLCANLIH